MQRTVDVADIHERGGLGRTSNMVDLSGANRTAE
ncbi:MAG: hypothetical protein QOG01_4351, partial [Pseudonocardiales bacterium]|nr:hypothetical protein [Pseudonocardiales bacterium]